MQEADSSLVLTGKTKKVTRQFQGDRPLSFVTAKGELEPTLGWHSQVYGGLQKASTIVASGKGPLPLVITTTIHVEPTAK